MVYQVPVMPGDGVGPEVMAAAQQVLAATGVPIEWLEVPAGERAVETHGNPVPAETVAAIREHGVALKGPLTSRGAKGKYRKPDRHPAGHSAARGARPALPQLSGRTDALPRRGRGDHRREPRRPRWRHRVRGWQRRSRASGGADRRPARQAHSGRRSLVSASPRLSGPAASTSWRSPTRASAGAVRSLLAIRPARAISPTTSG
jgi:hypothetical protein